MQRVREVEAIESRGLAGDRYAVGSGYYSRRDGCEVTLIEGETLDLIAASFRLAAHAGEHRRNIVTLRELAGKRLRVGTVVFEYDRPPAPCSYVERLTGKGMTRALGEGGGAGIAVRVLRPGTLREGAEIEVIEPSGRRVRYLP
jgi:MOSC domain-containing protein YiiM